MMKSVLVGGVILLMGQGAMALRDLPETTPQKVNVLLADIRCQRQTVFTGYVEREIDVADLDIDLSVQAGTLLMGQTHFRARANDGLCARIRTIPTFNGVVEAELFLSISKGMKDEKTGKTPVWESARLVFRNGVTLTAGVSGSIVRN